MPSLLTSSIFYSLTQCFRLDLTTIALQTSATIRAPELGPAIGSQGVSSLDHLPSVFECKVHLKLLDAIVRIKGKVNICSKEDGLREGVA
jgi:hypothetical protein